MSQRQHLQRSCLRLAPRSVTCVSSRLDGPFLSVPHDPPSDGLPCARPPPPRAPGCCLQVSASVHKAAVNRDTAGANLPWSVQVFPCGREFSASLSEYQGTDAGSYGQRTLGFVRTHPPCPPGWRPPFAPHQQRVRVPEGPGHRSLRRPRWLGAGGEPGGAVRASHPGSVCEGRRESETPPGPAGGGVRPQSSLFLGTTALALQQAVLFLLVSHYSNNCHFIK